MNHGRISLSNFSGNAARSFLANGSFQWGIMETNYTEREYRAVIGRNADAVLLGWAPLRSGEQRRAKFNVAAFFFYNFWFGYRKMYQLTFILYGAIIAETLVEELLFVGVLNLEQSPPLFGLIIVLIIGVVCGREGNKWYLTHVQRIIDSVRLMGLEEDDHFAMLTRKGGASIATGLGLSVLLVLGLLVIFLISAVIVESRVSGGLVV